MTNKTRKRIWLVVGASRDGIGAAIAKAAAKQGDRVIITGAETFPLSMPDGVETYHQLDVCNAEAISALAKQFSQMDVLVNCAAISRRDDEDDIDIFRHVIDVNLIGNFNVIKTFEPALIAAKGSVINIASMYSFLGSPKVPAYGASKAAIHQLTKSMALKYAPKGVRVNAIAPGFVVTEQTQKGRDDQEHYKAVIDRTPFSRWGNPDDIAGPAMFLASDQAAFMTGQTIIVDGGYSIG
ncbi:SDR family oxidoreductase [Alphaproteobacteria bacterium]|jgi:NAD(P)-dependent dehydrogenase (short-subunit alcohol dehydrogenase family)|nr:SDR family oxidoreductase [Alphaproteobacteria bacterium]